MAHGKKNSPAAGPLYDLIRAKFPSYVRRSDGILDVGKLADELGFTRAWLYMWFNANGLTLRSAARVIRGSNGRLTYAEIEPFIKYALPSTKADADLVR